jgi:cyanophycin synthetase
MIIPPEFEILRANQRFLAAEMASRGIDVRIFDLDRELLEARFESHCELFSDIDGSRGSYTASIVTGSKTITKRLLERESISVPRGCSFPVEEVEAIVAFAQEFLGFPVVVKPDFGVQGECVFTEIESADELRAAVMVIAHRAPMEKIVIEEHFEANEYRVFITEAGNYAVVHREPAHIVGDGVSTIEQLALAESHRRMNPRAKCLCEIDLDWEASQYLRRRARSFSSIPAYGEKVYLRGSSNVKKGGVPIDVTDRTHPSVIDICLRALRSIPGLPYAGIDFMCRDISQQQAGDSYRILEINSVPGIGIHIAPGRGQPRNVAAFIVDIIFPETVAEKRGESWAA